VVSIEADVFEVVVFAAGADAFLRVGGAGVAARNDARPFGDVRGALAEEDGHELVHAGVGEKEVGGIGQQARRGHDGVLLRSEEIEKRLSYIGTGFYHRRNIRTSKNQISRKRAQRAQKNEGRTANLR